MSVVRSCSPIGLTVLLAVLALAPAASAHVHMDSPNGGEVLDAGSVVTLQWSVVVRHNTMGWKLWYSTTGAGGPWILITDTLPLGNLQAGAIHTFGWTVPAVDSQTVRFRVMQDNSGTDYFDVSDNDITISASLTTDIDTVSISGGGVQTLSLNAGPAHGREVYAVFGTVSGTQPGISLPGGLVLPLNFDFYFDHTLQNPGAPPLGNSFSMLNVAGRATVTWTLPPNAVPPVAQGIVFHHAALTVNASQQVAFVSNAVDLTLVP